MTSVQSRVHVTPHFDEDKRERKDHWIRRDQYVTVFMNPWESYQEPRVEDTAKMVFNHVTSRANVMKDALKIPIVPPNFGVGLPSSDIKATWLGHASFLIELPTVAPAARGARILFDPVFSRRCGPVAFGMERVTPAPCDLQLLPDVDCVVISHNHADHLDLATIEQLVAKHSEPRLLIFLPLNTTYCLPHSLLPNLAITEMDWWENCDVEVDNVGSFTLTCLPAQHATGRGFFDKMHSLWAGWSIEGPGKTSKVWFAGDTGYCSVQNGRDGMEDSMPSGGVCPIFKEIGEAFGGFDLGLIPIGTYDPRSCMSAIHCDPSEAVEIFRETKCKKALGMHWGTWHMTAEPVDEPPRRLAEARTQLGVSADDFAVCAIGETRAFAARGV